MNKRPSSLYPYYNACFFCLSNCIVMLLLSVYPSGPSESVNEREERGEVDESERNYNIHESRPSLEEEKISVCLQRCDKLPVNPDGILILKHIDKNHKVNHTTKYFGGRG